MAFKIEDTKGDVKAKQNVKDSEVDKNTLDFKVKNTGGNVDAEQNIEGVKSSKGWVTAVIAIATVVGTIVTTIYSPEINDFIGGEEVEYTEEMPPPPEYVEPEPSNNLPIWFVPLLTGGFVIGKRLYNNYKAKKE